MTQQELARAALALIHRTTLKGEEIMEAHAVVQWLLGLAGQPVPVQTLAQEGETHEAAPSNN